MNGSGCRTATARPASGGPFPLRCSGAPVSRPACSGGSTHSPVWRPALQLSRESHPRSSQAPPPASRTLTPRLRKRHPRSSGVPPPDPAGSTPEPRQSHPPTPEPPPRNPAGATREPRQFRGDHARPARPEPRPRGTAESVRRLGRALMKCVAFPWAREGAGPQRPGRARSPCAHCAGSGGTTRAPRVLNRALAVQRNACDDWDALS